MVGLDVSCLQLSCLPGWRKQFKPSSESLETNESLESHAIVPQPPREGLQIFSKISRLLLSSSSSSSFAFLLVVIYLPASCQRVIPACSPASSTQPLYRELASPLGRARPEQYGELASSLGRAGPEHYARSNARWNPVQIANKNNEMPYVQYVKIGCQDLCQTECQIKWQIECQTQCQIKCQIEFQTQCQNKRQHIC